MTTFTEKSKEGQHKPDVGKVHGHVKDGSCGGDDGCGADFIDNKHVK